MVSVRSARLFAAALGCVLTVLQFLGPRADAATRAPTTLQLTTDHVPNGPLAGDPLRFHVWVKSDSPPSSSSNGTVTLKVGDTVIGSDTVPANDATAHITTAGLPRGEHTVVADYAGGPTWEPSRTSLKVTIVGRWTIGTVIVDGCSTRNTPPGSGGSMNCHPVGGKATTLEFLFDRHWEWTDHKPSGDVVFTASAPDSAFPSGFGPDVVARATIDGYHAVVTTDDLPVRARGGTVGCYTLRGDYLGDANFSPSFAMQSVCTTPAEGSTGSADPTPGTTPTSGGSGNQTIGVDGRPTSVPDGDESASYDTTTSMDATGRRTAPITSALDEIAEAGADDDAIVAAEGPTQRNGGTPDRSAASRGPLTVASGGLTAIALALVLAASIVGPWAPNRRRPAS
jgi:hypothetical protein